MRIAGVLSGLALGLAAASGAQAATTRVHTVVVAKMKFVPTPRGVRVGDVIQWINRDPVRHSATARDKSFDLDLPPNGSARLVVKRQGAVAYYCTFHPAMTARLSIGR